MRVSERAQRVRRAQAQLAAEIDAFACEHGLTDIEVLQAVSSWQAWHPRDPDRPADEEQPRPR